MGYKSYPRNFSCLPEWIFFPLPFLGGRIFLLLLFSPGKCNNVNCRKRPPRKIELYATSPYSTDISRQIHIVPEWVNGSSRDVECRNWSTKEMRKKPGKGNLENVDFFSLACVHLYNLMNIDEAAFIDFLLLLLVLHYMCLYPTLACPHTIYQTMHVTIQ